MIISHFPFPIFQLSFGLDRGRARMSNEKSKMRYGKFTPTADYSFRAP